MEKQSIFDLEIGKTYKYDINALYKNSKKINDYRNYTYLHHYYSHKLDFIVFNANKIITQNLNLKEIEKFILNVINKRRYIAHHNNIYIENTRKKTTIGVECTKYFIFDTIIVYKDIKAPHSLFFEAFHYFCVSCEKELLNVNDLGAGKLDDNSIKIIWDWIENNYPEKLQQTTFKEMQHSKIKIFISQ